MSAHMLTWLSVHNAPSLFAVGPQEKCYYRAVDGLRSYLLSHRGSVRFYCP